MRIFRTHRKALVLILITVPALMLAACSYAPADKGESSAAKAGSTEPAAAKEVPITTSSEEARQLYLRGRDLVEKLRFTEGNSYFGQAVEKDPAFALAWLAKANSSATANEFFDCLKTAVETSSKVSEGEKLMILGAEAGTKSEPAAQLAHFTKLVEMFPADARAHTLLGAYYFGAQDYPTAVEHYNHAISAAPSFSTPYNQLGYAYRFMGQYPEAERAFQKYIELIPGEPNPYDSYAELLMKMGRFDESIRQYEKALSIDPNFVASYIGIANDQIFMGKPGDALKTLGKLQAIARNDGERRQALNWMVATYLHEGKTGDALKTVDQMRGIAEKGKDLAAVSGDFQLIGDVFLETGSAGKAVEPYRKALETIESANVPAEVKEAVKRNQIYNDARVALAKGDLATAKAKTEEYRKSVEAKAVPFEMRQAHEMSARVAMHEGDYARSIQELASANQQDPMVLYLTAVACKKSGDAAKAKEMAEMAAKYNAENINYAYVRGKAQEMLKSL